MSAKFERPGSTIVTATAINIAMPACTIPCRAVAGELIALRPRMNVMTAMT